MNKAIFPVIFISLLTLLDFYGYQGYKHLIKDLNPTWQTVLKILYWSLSIFVFISIIGLFTGLLARSNSFWRTLFFGAIILNYLPKIIFVLFVFISDLWRGVQWIINSFTETKVDAVVPQPEENGITRSDFILKAGLLATAVPFVATSFGILSGAHDYRVRRKTIYFPNLPKAFDGIKVGQLSDIHTGSFYNKTAVKGGVDLLNSEKPDITFFTGDLVNDYATEVRDYIDVFDKINSPLGVHSILGNHDYGMYADWKNNERGKQKNLQNVIHAHKEMGWNILLNENRNITVDGQSIGLLGVENWGHGFIKAGDLKKAYTGSEENEFKILLSHDPSHWRDEVLPMYNDIDLTLSGHTHGMQFGLEVGDFQWSPVQYRYKEWGGLYTEGKQHIYVNRGYGFLAFPGRVGILPEVTILELKRG